MKNLLFVLAGAVLFSSCKSSIFGGKKLEKSATTGWNYNDKNMGGYSVSKETEQKTGPGLVFVQGGTFTMGATQEDVMGDWNNVPRRVTVSSFYIDRTEVANVHYREYLYWLENAFDDQQYSKVVDGAKPDTLVWRSELAANEPLVEYYFRHPSYNNYPVVGVSWKQANDYCIWRSNRVNELIMVEKGYINKSQLKSIQGQAEDNFTTKSYLMGLYSPQPGKPKKNPLLDANGKPRNYVKFEDGILMPDYRLPTEAEWEYAALGYVNQNPKPKKKDSQRGEELITNRQVYSWSQNVNGLRDGRHGSWQGKFLANFKRGNGDNMGVAGGLNDNASIPGPIDAFFPNGFGLYNMSGNVNEWVADVYRPLSNLDVDGLNPYRGNVYKKYYKNGNGEFERDIRPLLKKHCYDCHGDGTRKGKVAFDELSTEVIADGRHLDAGLLQLAYKIKGPDRLALVTDSSRALDMPDGGEYLIGPRDGGEKFTKHDGVGMLPDLSALASSVQGMDHMVRTFHALTGRPLHEVFGGSAAVAALFHPAPASEEEPPRRARAEAPSTKGTLTA